ncbi:phosphoglucosamine mutase [compost metagenome]
MLEDGSWVLARPSGTEPIIRVYLEAADQPALDKLAHAVERLVEEVAGPVPAGAH